MRYFLVLLVFFLAPVFSFAQEDKAEIALRQLIQELFDGMRASDSSKVAASFWPDARLTTAEQVIQDTVPYLKPADFARQIGRSHAGDLDERYEWETVRIDGNMAMAWTPYQFYYKGKFSHQGVNLFVLTQRNGIWKIQWLMDTRHRSDN